jgi:uncharacterized SAM-dependent methyltransferase
MHLESLHAQTAHVAGETFAFKKGETIHTESSHKFSIESFKELASGAGWHVSKTLSDPADYFSVHVLTQN